jgi:pyridoxine 4-dehydrogenase
VSTPVRTATLGDYSFDRIGLGTNRLTDTPENHKFLRGAVEAGLRLIDTAHLYSGGESERAIGAALAPFPNDLVVATKGGYRPGSGRPDRLRAELEESFERLRTDTITLYYLHRVDPEVPLEESLSVLREYHDAGRIEHVGVSDVSVDQIERARAVVPIAAVQNQYNLAERRYEDVVDYCEREGLLFVPYYPLHGPGSSRDKLAWLLERSPCIVPIPGTLSLEHLKANLAALDVD